MSKRVLILSAIVCVMTMPETHAQPSDATPLQLEAKIPLGSVKGRLDHFALDPHRHHLFLAELENDAVGVININQRKTVHTIRGLNEPQGVAYVASTDTLYVANGGD